VHLLLQPLANMSARRARSAGTCRVGFAPGSHDVPKTQRSHGGARSRDLTCDFYSRTDFSKFNTNVFQWQREDTFHTPRAENPCAHGNEVPLDVVLQQMKQEIVASCRADLKSSTAILRQDSDVFFKKILSQVKRVMAHQNETSFQLLTEVGRVMSTDDLNSLTADYRGEVQMLTQMLQAVEASADTLLGQHNEVCKTMSNMNSQLRKLVEDDADTRMSRATMEHQQELQQQQQLQHRQLQQQQQSQNHSQSQHVTQHPGLSRDSGVQLLTKEIQDSLVRMFSDTEQVLLRCFHNKMEESAMRDRDFEGRLLKIVENVNATNMVEQKALEQCEQAGVQQREQDSLSVAKVVSDRISGDLGQILHHVRLLKADVNLRITRDTKCKDVRVLISTGQLEQGSHSRHEYCRSSGAWHELRSLDSTSKLASAAAAGQAADQRSVPRSAVTKRAESASSTAASGPDDVLLACSQTTVEQDRGGNMALRVWHRASADMQECAGNVASRERTVFDEGDEAALIEVFRLADTNNNGTISQLEAVKALRSNDSFARAFGFKGRLQIREADGTRDLFRKAFQHVDTDGDNSITWEELVAYARSHVEESISGINDQDVMGDTLPLASFDMEQPQPEPTPKNQDPRTVSQ